MRRNLLDRAIAYVDPERGLRRAKNRIGINVADQLPDVLASAGSHTSTSGQDGFLKRWKAVPRSAKADTLRDLPALRGQSRDLYRNHPLAHSAIRTSVARAIGTGLALSPQPHAKTLGMTPEQAAEWAAETAAEFSLFADSRESDWYGDLTFYQQQDLVTMTRMVSGDGFTVLPDGRPTATQPYALRLQVLEADRVGNPGGLPDTDLISGGIRRAADGGLVTGIHVYDTHPGDRLKALRYAGQWYEPVGPSGRHRILHHFVKERPEQPRGVPYLAPVIALFKLLGDYTDAEIKAAITNSWLTLIIETETGNMAPIFGLQNPDAQAGGPTVIKAGEPQGPQAPAPADLEMGPGHVLALAKGEKATPVIPTRPSTAFPHFVDAVLDQLGAGTHQGRELLVKRFSTSYTAARAAFLDAWTHYRAVRTQTVIDFCQPVYETWLAEAVILGRIRAPGFFRDPRIRWAYTRALWFGDSQGSLNPKDEVKAMLDAIDGGLCSHERAEWELFGTDWNATYPTKLAEQRKMSKDGFVKPQRAGAAAQQQDTGSGNGDNGNGGTV